jgi:predicted N-acetyltransferase YhbS
MDVTRTSEKDMTPELDREIRRLQQEAFPRTVEFAQQRWWHTPPSDDELWFNARHEGRLVGSVRLVRRTVRTPDGQRTVGGIANVCSHPQARGLGAAKACMTAAQEYIAGSGQIDFGVLFCGDGVRPFYEKLGWKAVDNEVLVGDPPVRHKYNDPDHHGFIMVYPGRRCMSQWPAGTVNLDGQDW